MVQLLQELREKRDNQIKDEIDDLRLILNLPAPVELPKILRKRGQVVKIAGIPDVYVEPLRLHVMGKSDEEIAKVSGISANTVRTYISNTQCALKVPNKFALLRLCFLMGLLTVDEWMNVK